MRKIKNCFSLICLGLLLTFIFSKNFSIFCYAFQSNDLIGITAVPYDDWIDGVNAYFHYNSIDLISAWDIETGSKDIKVGVIDTGINFEHELLQEKYYDSQEFIVDENPHGLKYSHGTNVAGVIGAAASKIQVDNNKYAALSGICWDISLVSLKVVSGDGQTLGDVAGAINYATTNNIPILNMSLGLENTEELEEAIRNYPGLIVCAAGNAGVNTDNNPVYPTCYEFDNIISVGASNDADKRGIFNTTQSSNYGKNTVDLFAPGVDILTTSCTLNNNSSYTVSSGTSMAAPFVTGVAALLLSQNPMLTAKQLKYRILNSVDEVTDLKDLCLSGGRLNAHKALTFTHNHVANSFEYLNSTYHKCNCECGVSYQEKHNWVSNKPEYSILDIQPMYIPKYTCSICKKILLGPLPPEFI